MRSGLIAFSCERCQAASIQDNNGNEISNYIKESLGCEHPTQTPATWLDENEEWFNCPIQFISQSVFAFFEKYDSFKNGLSMPLNYEDQIGKFNLAVKSFEYYLNKFTEQKQGK